MKLPRTIIAEEDYPRTEEGFYIATGLPVGTRFLYRLEGSGDVIEGVLEEWSPSGKYCCVGWGEWVDADVRIVEILPPKRDPEHLN